MPNPFSASDINQVCEALRCCCSAFATEGKALLILVSCTAAALLPACGRHHRDNSASLISAVASSAPFNPASSAALADMQSRAAAMNAASWPVYNQLVETNSTDNLLFSPFSLTTAMALLYPAAAGTTGTTLAGAFQFDADPVAFAAKMQGLIATVYGSGTAAPDGSNFTLSQSSGVWLQQGQALAPGYLDTIKETYDANVNVLDFTGAPEAARQAINVEVSDDTSGRIQNILPVGSVSASTRLLLTNSLYVAADWQSPFTSQPAQPGIFTAASGATGTVTMMHQVGVFPYAATATFQAIALPYVGNDLALLILVPNAGVTLAAVEASLGPNGIATVMNSLTPTDVAVTLPKFAFSWNEPLNTALTAVGLGSLFDSTANFSGFFANAGVPPISLGQVAQETLVKVDDLGVTAAAASATGIDEAAGASASTAIVVDRPTFIAVVEMQTQAALLVGRLMQPTVAQ